MARRRHTWVWLGLGAVAALGTALYLFRRGSTRLITVFGPDEAGAATARVYAQRSASLRDSEIDGAATRLASNYPGMATAVFVYTDGEGFTHAYMGTAPNIEPVSLAAAVQQLEAAELTELATPATAALPAQAVA